MKQKNILAKLLQASFLSGKKAVPSRLHHQSTSLQSFLLSRTGSVQNCEGYTYRSVTACIH